MGRLGVGATTGFVELYETVETCNEIGKDDLIKLRELIDKKLHVYTSQ